MTFKHFFLAIATTVLVAGPASAQELNGTFKKVKDSGIITMGHREASIGFSYTEGSNKPMGYSIDICNRIIDEMKKELKMSSIEIKYQNVTSANRIPLVVNGTVDIECGTTTNNATRQKDVAFVVTTYVEEVRIAVKANSGIKSIPDLNGKTIATTTGTTSVQTLRKNKRATGVEFKEIFGKDHSDSFLLLESGRADAFVMDGSILAGNIATSKNPADFKLVGEPLSVEPIAIMIRKDDPLLKRLADDTVKGMIKSGEMTKLWTKWFLSPIPPKDAKVGLALSAGTKAAWDKPNDKPAEDYAQK